MQTLHLRFRDLRAISPGQSPSRWQTPSMRSASKWETASPLPKPLGPTCAVGWRPASLHPDGILYPVAGVGMSGVPRLRAARIVGPVGANPCLICRGQTADAFHQSPATNEAGEIGGTHRQARASESRWLASGGLSFPLRPQRYGARASRKKTSAQPTDSSGTSRSGATGLRPTGRLDHHVLRKRICGDPISSCGRTLALVTGQEPVGAYEPDPALRHRLRLCSMGH